MTECPLLWLVAAFFIQSTALIAAGLLSAKCLMWNAAARHTVLFVALASVVTLPAFELAASAYGLSLLPTFHTNPITNSADGAATETTRVKAAFPATLHPNELVPPEDTTRSHRDGILVSSPPAATSWLAATWCLGVGVLLVRWLRSIGNVARLRRSAVCADQPTRDLFNEVAPADGSSSSASALRLVTDRKSRRNWVVK